MAIVLIRAVRTKKNANYGVQLFLKRPFRLGCFVFFFRNSWCSQVEWYSVMFSRENPFCYFINHETASFLIICFCSSVSYFIPFFFFLLFSLFFLLSFFFINYDKVFFFSFHLLLFFVLVFPCVSNAARRCQQRSSTGRSTPPLPLPQKVLLNRGWSIRVSGKLFTYPSSKPPLTLTSHLGQNVGLREGLGRQFPKKINWSDDSNAVSLWTLMSTYTSSKNATMLSAWKAVLYQMGK